MPTFVGTGDSITSAAGQAAQEWPQRVHNKIEAAHAGSAWNVYNTGAGGAQTTTLSGSPAAFSGQGYAPSVIGIMIGVNDAWAIAHGWTTTQTDIPSSSVEIVRASISSFLDYCLALPASTPWGHPLVILLGPSPAPAAGHSRPEENMRAVEIILREEAAFRGVPFASMLDEFRNVAVPSWGYPATSAENLYWTFDELHLNDLGQEVVASKFYSMLTPYLAADGSVIAPVASPPSANAAPVHYRSAGAWQDCTTHIRTAGVWS